MALITVKDLSVDYDRREAIHDVSVEVNAGDYICIVGPNGSGKSTLLKAMLGLVRPFSGSVTLGGGFSRRDTGYLPQQTPLQRDFPASVFEVAVSGFCAKTGLRPFFSRTQKEKARRWLDRLGLAEYEKQSYRALSGGQQQRVLLVRAFCAADKALLLDEPAASLDAQYSRSLYEILREINDGGVAVVMVSHDLQAAAAEAKSIIHMETSVLYCGDAAGYLKSEPWRRMTGGGQNA